LKNLFLICALIRLTSLLVSAQTHQRHLIHQTKQEKMEARALARINALYEVKDFIKHAKGSDPIVVLDSDPDTTWNYYQIKVGIANSNMLRTNYHFFVAPKTFKIYIWDQMDDTGEVPIHLISLQRWREWRHDPRFNNSHTFKDNKLIALDKNGNPVHGKK